MGSGDLMLPTLARREATDDGEKGSVRMRRILIAVLVVIGVGACAASLYYWNEIRTARAETGMLVKQAFDRFGREVALKDMPASRIDLLLKIEDPKFREHHGVDLATPGAGMTTITQGLVKLLYFPGGFRQGIGKVRQTLIAEYALDHLVSKNEQLELYLNATYFGAVDGRPVHGLAAASNAYFKKPFSALSDDEFIALIGMTISPETLKPGTANSTARVARIKRYLAGEVVPASVLDVEYVGKLRGTPAEEALMTFLRSVTHADPMIAGRGEKG